jgi:hypothetical protein
MRRAAVFKWWKRFRDGETGMKDEPRSGRPNTAPVPLSSWSLRRTVCSTFSRSEWKYTGKVLCALTEHHVMNVYWGVEVYLHSFFNLGTRWRWVVSFTPRPLYPQGKSPWYPLNRLEGPQSRSGREGEEKNSQPPPGIEPSNPDRPALSPEAL